MSNEKIKTKWRSYVNMMVKSRKTYLSIFFAFIGALPGICLPIEEINSFLIISLGSAFGLVGALLSFFMFDNWLKRKKYKYIQIAIITSAALLILFAGLYFYSFDQYTYKYVSGYFINPETGKKHKTAPVRHLSGCWYSEDAQVIIDSGKNQRPPEEISVEYVVKNFISINTGDIMVEKVWSTDSLRCAKWCLLGSTLFLLLCFVTACGLLIENSYSIRWPFHFIPSQLHFEDLGGDKFEQVVLQYLIYSLWQDVEWIGQSGNDSGIDIRASKQGEQYIFQCANYKTLDFRKIKQDLDKIKRTDVNPINFIVVCGGRVSAQLRQKIKVYAKSLGAIKVEVWTGFELECKIRKETPFILPNNI
jgi:hypothetical protein